MSLELEEKERFQFHRLSPREKVELLRELGEELSKHEEILLAIVFSSFLRDYPLRDIDVAVYIAGSRDPLSYELELEEELERKISYPVDIVVLNNAPPWLIEKVLEIGKQLFTKQPGLREKTPPRSPVEQETD